MQVQRSHLCDSCELEQPYHPEHLDRLERLTLRPLWEDESRHLKRNARDKVNDEPAAEVPPRDCVREAMR